MKVMVIVKASRESEAGVLPDEIEIRQIFEADELGEGFTPELRAQEERLRAEMGQRQGRK